MRLWRCRCAGRRGAGPRPRLLPGCLGRLGRLGLGQLRRAWASCAGSERREARYRLHAEVGKRAYAGGGPGLELCEPGAVRPRLLRGALEVAEAARVVCARLHDALEGRLETSDPPGDLLDLL